MLIMADEPIRILLVDDDSETRDVYTQYFREAGFQMDEAENGMEGLERVQETNPDLIISGIVMPKMDGFTFARVLREDPKTAHIPIIFLSHLGRQDNQDEMKGTGVDDFIVRDVTPLKEVEARVLSLLDVTLAEYILEVNLESYDGKRFAETLGLPENLRVEQVSNRYVLRLRRVEGVEGRFDAKIISA